MNKRNINNFKEKLLNEKNKIQHTIDDLNENTSKSSLKEYTSELSVYDNHPADIATEIYMAGQDMNLRRNEVEILNKIEDALLKIENNVYGKCEKCGKDIHLDRLDFIPYASTCTKCMSHENITDEMNTYRPLEEDSLKYPFGRTNKDVSEEDFVGTDGEDIYQHVEEFNKVKNDPSFSTGDNVGVFDETESGIVEDVDKITNQYYKKQIE